MEPSNKAVLSWAFVGLLALLCAALALIQNRWIYEVSVAERDRLRSALQSGMEQISRDFDREIARSCSAITPRPSEIAELGREAAYSARYTSWATSNGPLFRRIGLARFENGEPALKLLDLNTAQFASADWPSDWQGERQRLAAWLNGGGPQPLAAADSAIIDTEDPREHPGPPPRGDHSFRPEPGPPRPGEQAWLIVELNLDYIRSTLLPSLLAKNLSEGNKLSYDAEVIAEADPAIRIWQTTSDFSRFERPDSTIPLLSADRHMGQPHGPPPPETAGPPPKPPSERARWRLLVRRRGDSLDGLVAHARWKNIAVSGGIILLILATVASLFRFTRESQRLAELQMNFVAGISHELRTPLTVMRTASYNLCGKLATRPEQVEKYGRMIRQETEKLTMLVEQVLRYGSARAGNAIRERRPVASRALIESAMRSSTLVRLNCEVVVEKQIDTNLPIILADEVAMKHALGNLLDNAVKYGLEGNNWIGVFARTMSEGGSAYVEFRVADRGPGIPPEEQEHLFDAFFRGRRAIEDQVNGTGLGLNLVKRIVDAHGGTVSVASEPSKVTEFIVRIPVAPPELQDQLQDDFAHISD